MTHLHERDLLMDSYIFQGQSGERFGIKPFISTTTHKHNHCTFLSVLLKLSHRNRCAVASPLTHSFSKLSEDGINEMILGASFYNLTTVLFFINTHFTLHKH